MWLLGSRDYLISVVFFCVVGVEGYEGSSLGCSWKDRLVLGWTVSGRSLGCNLW